MQVPIELRCRVRVTIRKIQGFVDFELTAEAQLVVVATSARVLALEIILSVLDLRTASFPHERPIWLLLGNEHPHPVVEQGIGFGVIEDVEAEFVGLRRLYLVEEPLDVALGVGVVLKDEVVLCL